MLEYECFIQLKKTVEVEPGCLKRRKEMEQDIDEFLRQNRARIREIRMHLSEKYKLDKNFEKLDHVTAMKLFLLRSNNSFSNAEELNFVYKKYGQSLVNEQLKNKGNYEAAEDLINVIKMNLCKNNSTTPTNEMSEELNLCEKG